MKKAILTGLLVTCGLVSSPLMAGDAAAGKAKSMLCAGCHGQNGEGKESAGSTPAYPALAGQVEGYFIKIMGDFKSGARKDASMNALSAGLSDADIANLATYYKGL